MLPEPIHHGRLCAFKALLLDRIAGIASDCKAVAQTGEKFVSVVQAQGWNGLVAELPQLGRQLMIVFRRNDLDGHATVLDLASGEETGVGCRDTVDQMVAVGSQLKHRPAAVAVSHGADFGMSRLEFARELEHLRAANLLGMAADEVHEVDLARVQFMRVQYLAVEAGEKETKRPWSAFPFKTTTTTTTQL